MARVRFDGGYVSRELRKVGNALTTPVNLYLIGGAAMIRYGLKAATKDIDVLFSTHEEAVELVRALGKSGYHPIQTSRLTPDYQTMFATQILENADGFRWDIFHEFVCRKLRLSPDMIKRARSLQKAGHLTVWLISKEDIFLLKSVTERDDDVIDLLMLARSKLDWGAVLKECLNQSREDFICEIDLYDKLDTLKTSYGLETSIYDSISKIAQDQMEKWLEDVILRELDATATRLDTLLKRFGCEKETLLPSLAHLEKIGRIKRVGEGYAVNEKI